MTAIRSITLHSLAIPMKQRVEHAASARAVADPALLFIELQTGEMGVGETLPRQYVTGEDHAGLRRTIEEVFVPRLLSCKPASFSEALDVVESLPHHDADGRRITAARAAVELALLEAYGRRFGRDIVADAVNWLELSDAAPGSLQRVRVSGVLASTDPPRVLRTLRRMRCYGLRDFKLKVGFDGDDELLTAVCRVLAAPMARGACTLRLDANGAWTLEQAITKLRRWTERGIACIEQPLPPDREHDLPALREATGWRLMHDESLVTLDDARRLLQRGVADLFNIRIAKVGGLLPALALAGLARRHGVEIMLGCMVGQTSLLSAVERRFLQHVGGVRFVEGNYGRFLLRADVVPHPLRFGYGGRLKPLPGPGWGILVDRERVTALQSAPPHQWVL